MNGSAAARAPANWNWIVSRNYDLGFFVFSTIASFLVLAFHWFLGYHLNVELEKTTGLYSFLLFTALFDLPHIFQTFSRTHFDKTEYRRHTYKIQISLIFLLIAGNAVDYFGHFKELREVGAVIGIWHILRQNVGFMRIYKLKNPQREAPLDNWFDYGIFYAVLATYLMMDVFYAAVPAWAPKGLSSAFGIAFVGRQLWLFASGKGINGPKVLFIASVLSVYSAMMFIAHMPILLFIAVETIYHNIQYFGWIRIYQKKTFSLRASNIWFAATTGAGILSALVLALAMRSQQPGAEGLELQNPVFSVISNSIFMLILYHYYIDGVIWKVKEAPELRGLIFDAPVKPA